MHGVSGIDLGTGEYTITPAMELSEARGVIRDMASREDAEYHFYDVERPDGTTEFELVKRLVIGGSGVVRSADVEYLLRPPDGDPVLSLERGGLRSPHELRAVAGDEVLATWRRAFLVAGPWKVADPTGEVVAEMRRARSLGNALSFSKLGTYSVTTPDGTRIARFHGLRAGGLDAGPSSELEVTLERSSIPPEVVLGLGSGIVAV